MVGSLSLSSHNGQNSKRQQPQHHLRKFQDSLAFDLLPTMVVSITEEKFMALGLDIAGFKNWEICKEKTNMERFQGWYEAKTKTCAAIWADLQMTTDEVGRIESDANPVHLLLALRFLRAYPSELELSGSFQMSEKTVRKWSDLFVRKIQSLKSKKARKTNNQ